MVAATVVMISPEAFHANAETAASNAFQQVEARADDGPRALEEFQRLASRLITAGIQVHRFDGRMEPRLPDQVFPNNWFSTHADGTLVLYPLLAPNRRAERRTDIIDELKRSYVVCRVLDLSSAEADGRFLEGTGSVVIDHHNGIAFAALSPRTDPFLARLLGRELGLEIVTFRTRHRQGQPVYHTNVVMSIAPDFAIWCPGVVPAADERDRLRAYLGAGQRDTIEISLDQMERFAANLLALGGSHGPVIALSQTALGALEPGQARCLADHGEILCVPLQTLERLGGGSVRCMLAEVYLPVREQRPEHV